MELTNVLVLLSVLCLDHVSCFPGKLYKTNDWETDLGQLLVDRIRRETHVSGNPEEVITDQGTQQGNQDPNIEPSLQDSGSAPEFSTGGASFHGTQDSHGNIQDPTHSQADLQATAGIKETPSDIPADTHSEPAPETYQNTYVDNPTEIKGETLTGTHTDIQADAPTETHLGQLHDTISDPRKKKPQSSGNPLLMSRPGELAPLALPLQDPNKSHQGHSPTSEASETLGNVQKAADTTGTAQIPTAKSRNSGQAYHIPHHSEQAPKALPQTGAKPSRERAPDARGQLWGRQFRPVAMPQKQGPPKNTRQGNQATRQRPPPNWGTAGNKRPAPAKGQASAPGPANRGQQPPPSPMPGMPPHPMFDYRYYNPYYRYMYGPPQAGQGSAGSQAGGSMPTPPGYPYPPYPPYRMGGDRPDMENFGPGYNLDIRGMGGYPCMNMSDPMCMQQRMMGEMDIETPYGEMDIEPYELDIEGPMAYGMLKNLGFGNFTNSHYPEITLNQHILDAMQKRFGVNTSAGIQSMSTNPEFQAFMYQVLTHSSPVSLAEFNANLTKAQVNQIISNLDTSPQHRLQVTALNHAMLSPQGPSSNGASLTLDNNPATNLWANLGAGMPFSPFPAFPGQTAPLVQQPAPHAQQPAPPVQNPRQPVAAVPGRFQALVQKPPPGEGGTGEAAKAKEGTGQRNPKAEQEANEKVNPTGPPTGKNKTTYVTVRGGKQAGVSTTARLVAAKAKLSTDSAKSSMRNTELLQTTGNKGKTQPEQSQVAKAQTDQSQVAESQAGKLQTGQSHSGSKGTVSQDGRGTVSNVAISTEPKQTSMTKEQDIIGKESNKGISKDERTRSEKIKTMSQPTGANVNKAGSAAPADGTVDRNIKTPGATLTNSAANIPAGNAGKPGATLTNTNPAGNAGKPSATLTNTNPAGNAGKPSATLTNTNPAGNAGKPGATLTNSPANNPVFKQDSIPIGIKEAGLVPSVMNNTVAVKAETGYTSTGFAIAAATIIALIIILGPITCMLWRMKEKRQERLRKEKAHKNRDLSENNIMESMVLHDFGKAGTNSVINEKAYDYFKFGKDRYSSINADVGEMDRFSGNPEFPHGRLP